MASLANKTALVTGASRGIGRATAEALAKVRVLPKRKLRRGLREATRRERYESDDAREK